MTVHCFNIQGSKDERKFSFSFNVQLNFDLDVMVTMLLIVTSVEF